MEETWKEQYWLQVQSEAVEIDQMNYQDNLLRYDVGSYEKLQEAAWKKIIPIPRGGGYRKTRHRLGARRLGDR